MAALPAPPQPTVDAIYRAYEDEAKNYPSARIGASGLGAECDRAIWYQLRWVKQKRFIGRMLRLFDTGKIEENRMVADIRRAGVTVLDLDPDTGKQWTFTDTSGHLVAKLDGAALGLHEAPKTWHLCEFKTYNKKAFAELQKKKVRETKPEHWWQCQMGMHWSGMTRAFYMALCKDNEELYSERLEYDAAECIRMEARGQRIAYMANPPSRISDDPAWYKCKFCDFHSVCHTGDGPDANCRTCLHVTPRDGAAWFCERWQKPLTLQEQKEGCGAHLYIPSLIGGEQIDAAEDGAWILYRMPDGSEWRDGVQA